MSLCYGESYSRSYQSTWRTYTPSFADSSAVASSPKSPTLSATPDSPVALAVVKTQSADIKRFAESHLGTGKEFEDVDFDDFLQVEDALIARGIKYAYYSDARKLFIQCPSETHEALAKAFQRIFETAMEAQQMPFPQPLQWESGTAKTVYKLEGEGEIIEDQLCADFTIYGPLNKPYLAVEIAYSQTLANVNEKVLGWLSIPSVVGVIAVDIQESPAFKAPEKSDQQPLALSKEEWSRAVALCPRFGPLNVNGVTWAGKHSVNVAVHRRDRPIVEQSVIPATLDLAKLNDALDALWGETVRVVCPQGDAVPAKIDWSVFEAKLVASLSETGYCRRLKWVSSVLKRKKDPEEQGSTGQMKRKKLVAKPVQ